MSDLIFFRRESEGIKRLAPLAFGSPTFTQNKGGWQCGKSFIPKKNKCYTDPTTGRKTKTPLTFNQYRKKTAAAVNVEQSASISQNANTTLVLFEKQKRQTGKIDKILNLSAERLANGEKKETVIKQARSDIEEYLKSTFKYGREESSNKSGKGIFSRKSETMTQFQTLYPTLASFASDKRSKEYNKKIAMKVYKEGKPGLLEKAGIIPNRKGNSPTYTRKSSKGTLHIVRKSRKKANKNLILGAEGLGIATGAAGGAKLGGLLVKATGHNGMIRKTAMGGGGLAGGAIAMMLANKLVERYGDG